MEECVESIKKETNFGVVNRNWTFRNPMHSPSLALEIIAAVRRYDIFPFLLCPKEFLAEVVVSILEVWVSHVRDLCWSHTCDVSHHVTKIEAFMVESHKSDKIRTFALNLKDEKALKVEFLLFYIVKEPFGSFISWTLKFSHARGTITAPCM